MRALLVNPKFPLTFWGMELTAPITGKAANLPPLGLLTAAALLPRHWELRFVDMNVEPLLDSSLRWADVVLVGGMRIQSESFHDVVARAHGLGRRVIAGGPYVTTDPDAAADVDHLVLGEAEETLLGFAHAFEAGDAPRIVKAPRFPDVTHAPVPRFDLVNMDRYNCLGVQFSRGCPFNCEFCDIIEIFGRVPRTKPPAQVLKELNAILATGFRGAVFLVDDNFIGNKAQAKKLLAPLREWQREHGQPFELFTEASVNLAADDALVDGMVEAGFTGVFLGIETPSKEALRETQKFQNVAFDLDQSVEKLVGRGLEVMAGFIVGFDADTEDVFDRQIEFINRSPISMAMVGMLIALPGTQLWKRLEREGRLREGGDGNNATLTNFVTRLPDNVLARGYMRLLSAVYEPTNYFRRCLRMLSLARDVRPRTNQRPFAYSARCLLQSFFRQGILSSYRRAYWSYLFKSIRVAPRRFVHAVALAIRGEHFIRYAAESVLPGLETQLGPAPEQPVEVPAPSAFVIGSGRALAHRELSAR
jgi:radical SAM superfamily enzyme YgiQ (UPF0313 family)